jgi:hypothetical protein
VAEERERVFIIQEFFLWNAVMSLGSLGPETCFAPDEAAEPDGRTEAIAG